MPPRSCRPTFWPPPRRRTSTTVSPPRHSLVSTKGPSVNVNVPLVASALKTGPSSSRPPANTYSPAAFDLVHDRHGEWPAPAEPLLGVVTDPLLVEVDEVLGHVCSLGSGGPGVRLHVRYERRPTDTTPSGGKLHAGVGVAAVAERVLREVLLALPRRHDPAPLQGGDRTPGAGREHGRSRRAARARDQGPEHAGARRRTRTIARRLLCAARVSGLQDRHHRPGPARAT